MDEYTRTKRVQLITWDCYLIHCFMKDAQLKQVSDERDASILSMREAKRELEAALYKMDNGRPGDGRPLTDRFKRYERAVEEYQRKNKVYSRLKIDVMETVLGRVSANEEDKKQVLRHMYRFYM